MIQIQRFVLMPIVAIIIGMPCIGLGDNGYLNQRIMDAIELRHMDDRLVAFKAGAAPSEIELAQGELVRTVRTLGNVGGVVTSDRMLAISVGALEWFAMPLEMKEVSADPYLSDNLVLFITQERAITFDSTLNRFVTVDIPLGENVITQRAAPNATVVVTLNRAIGYAAGNADFNEIPFSTGEIFRQLEVSAGLITVVTSDRILLFHAPSAEWEERDKPIG